MSWWPWGCAALPGLSHNSTDGKDTGESQGHRLHPGSRGATPAWTLVSLLVLGAPALDHEPKPIPDKGHAPLGTNTRQDQGWAPRRIPAATYPLKLSKKSSWLSRASERLRGGRRCSAGKEFLCAGRGVLGWEPSPKATPELRDDMVLHLGHYRGEGQCWDSSPQPQGRASGLQPPT